MRPRSLTRWCVSLFVAALAAQACAAEQGAVIPLSALAEADRQALVAGIEQARSEDPGRFGGVRQTLHMLLEIRVRSIVGSDHVTRRVEFGRDDLFSLLELIAVRGPERGDLRDGQWLDVQGWLIGSVGRLRDPRALPVLEAVLRSEEVDPALLLGAAAAIARLESDEAADLLLSILDDPSEPKARRDAVLRGIGFCGRARVALRLADLLAQAPEPETACAIVDSLGQVGNFGLWATQGRPNDEEKVVRTVAAEAALRAFLAYDEEEVRTRAKGALMLVGDLSMLSLIETQQRSVTAPEDLAALEKLKVECEQFWERSRPAR